MRTGGDGTSEEGKDGVEGMVGGLGEFGVWNRSISRSWLTMSWVIARIIESIRVEITDCL